MAVSWFVTANGIKKGPISESQVRSLIQEGSVTPTDFVWREGMDEWEPVGEYFPLANGISPPGVAGMKPGMGTSSPTSPYGSAPHVSSSDSNRLAASLLAIFLGSLGIHKFYLGYTQAGVIMLLVSLVSCGIAAPIVGVIALIEGIIYISKSDTEFYNEYVAGDKQWF